MKEYLEEIEQLIAKKLININEVKQKYKNFIKNKLKGQHCVENYIGDYPTFIEPVFIGTNVKIGDDVLIGPNVYIGNNCEIGNYTELVNTILFDNVLLGDNFKLENCIIAKESKLKFNNFSAFSCILIARTDSKEDLKKISF
ncbi:MAG: hypothetical protein ACFFAH_01660 [Promethearchaeota archaeon]